MRAAVVVVISCMTHRGCVRWSGPTVKRLSADRRNSGLTLDRGSAFFVASQRFLDRADFATGFALMAAQRHTRIVGLFVRLLRRDGKPDYLPYLPRVWGQLERALKHEALTPVRAWIDRLLPPALRRIGS